MKTAISFGSPSYKYFMFMLPPLDKATVLTSERLEDLYKSMMEKFVVTYKQIYGFIACAFVIALNHGDVNVLKSIFGSLRLLKRSPTNNLSYIKPF